MKLILSCEHGGNDIPKKYSGIFKNHEAVLETHRGFDLGALDVFNHLKSLSYASFYCTRSRLLIELNRSLHHKNLFSEFSKQLSKPDQDALISEYLEYRNSVEQAIQKLIKNQQKVLHISVHSFTPIFNSEERHGDIGLLFDSRKTKEKDFCKALKHDILKQDSDLNVRYNYPYLGKSDGFTSYLRKQFPEYYLGIEIEINQKFSENNFMKTAVKTAIYNAISGNI